MGGYKHYIRTDANGVVVLGFSTAFPEITTPEPTDICVEEDAGRHFTLQLTNPRGQFRYKIVSGILTERTQTELDAEWSARPPAPETDAQKIARLETEKAELQQSVGQLNADFSAFTEFYFTKFPEQA